MPIYQHNNVKLRYSSTETYYNLFGARSYSSVQKAELQGRLGLVGSRTVPFLRTVNTEDDRGGSPGHTRLR